MSLTWSDDTAAKSLYPYWRRERKRGRGEKPAEVLPVSSQSVLACLYWMLLSRLEFCKWVVSAGANSRALEGRAQGEGGGG